MKLKRTFKSASVGIITLSLLTGCTQGSLVSKNILSPPAHTLPELDQPETPAPIPDPGDLVGADPETVASKAVVEEVVSIQASANDIPELALTADDLDILADESLLDSPDQLKGWVK